MSVLTRIFFLITQNANCIYQIFHLKKLNSYKLGSMLYMYYTWKMEIVWYIQSQSVSAVEILFVYLLLDKTYNQELKTSCFKHQIWWLQNTQTDSAFYLWFKYQPTAFILFS